MSLVVGPHLTGSPGASRAWATSEPVVGQWWVGPGPPDLNMEPGRRIELLTYALRVRPYHFQGLPTFTDSAFDLRVCSHRSLPLIRLRREL